MSKLALLLLILCVVGALAEQKVFQKKLQQRRLTANEIIARRKNLPTTGKLFQVGMPFDYIFDVVTLGNPGREFGVSLETGYSGLWVFGQDYPNLSEWNEVYDPSNSTTSVDKNTQSYGYSGVNTLHGHGYTDELNYFFQPFNQSFNAIDYIYTSVGGDSPSFDFSGILGLAWDTSESGQPSTKDSSPFLGICDSLGVPRIFSLWQERDVFPDGDVMAIGIMSYGSPDIGNCLDDLQYFPITKYSPTVGLNFEIKGFNFGSYSKSGDWLAQLDTGISIIYVPSTIQDRISRTIKVTFNSEIFLYTTDCDQTDTLADWIFTIGGRKWNLPASQYLIDIDLPDNQCVAAFDVYGGFADFVFGQPMLRQYCSVFDAENNQIGLATAIHDNPSTETTTYIPDSSLLEKKH